jgi:hypothetical protein
MHVRLTLKEAEAKNRRLVSEESSIQLSDFVPRHRVSPPSGVPQRHRPTLSTVRREKLNFGRLRQRPRGLHRDVIQADAAIGVRRKSHRDAVSLKPLPRLQSFPAWSDSARSIG